MFQQETTSHSYIAHTQTQ